MNVEIIELQRELLLNQLWEVENQLNDNGLRRGKGYTLFLRNGKYYVKYTDPQTGKQIPTNRCLYTNDIKEAHILAKKYRESFLKSYFDKKNRISDISKFFSEYYQLDKSPYLQEVLEKKTRKIRPQQIKSYNRFINKYFIQFMAENKIKKIGEITLPKLADFQTYLLRNGLGESTINDRIQLAIKPIFTNLLTKGVIKETPFPNEKSFKFNLPESESRKRPEPLEVNETLAVLTGTDIWKLYKTREDYQNNIIANENHYKKYRLLCLLIATCGLRNAEIFMLRKENIIKIRRTWFLDIVNSRIEEQGLKTESSKRKVPIPSITLKALNEYIEENNITDYLFYTGSSGIHYNTFMFAKNQFGVHCGYDEKTQKEINFNFYALRHFYRSLLGNSHIDKDAIEYCMGHKVNVRKMSENYNHIDLFLHDIGSKVVEYIDEQFNKVLAYYDLMPVPTYLEQVSLSNSKGKFKTYYANVLSNMEYEDEVYHFLEDLQEKELLPDTHNENELLIALDILLENETIDKERYKDCVHYIKNMNKD